MLPWTRNIIFGKWFLADFLGQLIYQSGPNMHHDSMFVIWHLYN